MEKIYTTPLSIRYASKEMNEIWSPDMKYRNLEEVMDSSCRNRKRAWN